MSESLLKHIKPQLIRNNNEIVTYVNISQDISALKGWEIRVTVEPSGWDSGIIAFRDNLQIKLPDIARNSVVKLVFYNYYGVRISSCFTARISSPAEEAYFVQTELTRPQQQKKTHCSSFLIIFLLTAAFACISFILFDKNQEAVISQAIGTLHAPVFSVGDSYTYSTIDHIAPNYGNTAKKEIISIDGKQLVMRKTYLESKTTYLITYDLNLGLKAGSEENTFEPAYKYFNFPSKIGQSWEIVSTERTKNGKIKTHKLSGSIISLEKITVPAGSFDTWKIVLNSVVTSNDGKVERYGTDTSWYAPAVKNSVKSELESKDAAEKIIGRKTVKLIEYSLNN
ncbi:hypothetical protein VU05_03305 [Desulfobulbus sp. F1]|nr:hypothetical protein [Desulfobulbus sp. F1]